MPNSARSRRGAGLSLQLPTGRSGSLAGWAHRQIGSRIRTTPGAPHPVPPSRVSRVFLEEVNPPAVRTLTVGPGGRRRFPACPSGANLISARPSGSRHERALRQRPWSFPEADPLAGNRTSPHRADRRPLTSARPAGRRPRIGGRRAGERRNAPRLGSRVRLPGAPSARLADRSRNHQTAVTRSGKGVPSRDGRHGGRPRGVLRQSRPAKRSPRSGSRRFR
jgi:hypothetical protein